LKQAQRGRTVGAAALFKDFLPAIFRVSENRSYKLARMICRRAALSRLLLGWRRAIRENFRAPDQDAGIDPESPSEQAKDDDCAESKPAGPATREAAASPHIFDVLAPPEIFPAHGRLTVLEIFIRLALAVAARQSAGPELSSRFREQKRASGLRGAEIIDAGAALAAKVKRCQSKRMAPAKRELWQVSGVIGCCNGGRLRSHSDFERRNLLALRS
jgi:hypothetical protein